MYGQSIPSSYKSSHKASGKSTLLRDLSSDDEDDNSDNDIDNPNSDPKKPWLAEFHRYLNSTDYVEDGMSIIQWWGVSAIFHRP